MSRSVLLQLARDSIQEVIEARNSINKEALLQEHPLLNHKIPTTLKLYIEDELRGSYETQDNMFSLLDAIVIGAKKAAFEDSAFKPITTAEYLSCHIELILQTPDGLISEKDEAILKKS